MLKEFWESKKHLVQLIGILLGAGALFLAIPRPESVKAQDALANIQFIWLVFITCGVVVLFVQFFNLTVDVERKIRENYRIDVSETLSVLILLTLLYLVYNLWSYIIDLYKISFIDYFKHVSVALFFLYGALHYHVWRWLVLKIPDRMWLRKIVFSLFAHAILSLVIGIGINYLSDSFYWKSFFWKSVFRTSIICYIVILLLGFWEDLKTSGKSKIKA